MLELVLTVMSGHKLYMEVYMNVTTAFDVFRSGVDIERVCKFSIMTCWYSVEARKLQRTLS